jgi:hypothetical protein
MSDFHPAALTAMQKTLRGVPADRLPTWGEYFDGPEYRYSVRVTLGPDGRFSVAVMLPPDFSVSPPSVPVDAAASAQLTEAANGDRALLEPPTHVSLPHQASAQRPDNSPKSPQLSLF